MEPNRMVRSVENEPVQSVYLLIAFFSYVTPVASPEFVAPDQCLLFPVTISVEADPKLVILYLDHDPVPRTRPLGSCSVPRPALVLHTYPVLQDQEPV